MRSCVSLCRVDGCFRSAKVYAPLQQGRSAVDGYTELLQFAHILRVGADAARDVVLVRQVDVDALDRIANQAVAMATELEAIALSVRSKPSAGSVSP